MDNDQDLLKELLLELSKENIDPEPSDELICECHVVGLHHLRDVAREYGTLELNQLQLTTGLGTGCGSCLKSSDCWMKKLGKIL